MSDLDITENIDPWFNEHDGHVIAGGEGVFCPGVDGFYDPPKGLERGDDCPVCGDTLNV